jgi:DNA-binding HxlR family transcriptional regulator
MTTDSERPLRDADGYGQLCAVGFALDTIGDRWTLLVLRDLARTPLRFRDLQAINPGMSPNLLTTRLRKLEDADLVERTPLQHGPGHLYALTPDTRDMVLPVLTATANLGAFLIDRIPLDQLMAMDLPTVLTDQMRLNGHFMTARATDLRGNFTLDMGGIATYIKIDDAGFQTSSDAPENPPIATITCFPPTVLMRIMGHGLSVDDAEAAGLLQIHGDRPAALELLLLLSFA